jgi:5-oxoprolinase (ATP-hydrolysing)
MGGTSTDVCRVAGETARRDSLRIGGLSLRVPAVELDTIAAGGGSILAVRAGTYEVGPASAGADPGPAAYGRGGPATLTDVEAVLGRLPMFPAICGPERDRPLDVEAAHRALQALDPSRSVEAIAIGFREVAAETMARAVRRLAASLGVDPRAHGLVAFGGAGPAHACAIAERLGIDTVVVPVPRRRLLGRRDRCSDAARRRRRTCRGR